ncbi:MAG: hypothetical protein RLZZ628_2314 [Bacteroidota bacterium]|jgi:hypothetical protein
MNLRDFWAAEAAALRDTSSLLNISELLNVTTDKIDTASEQIGSDDIIVKKIINQIRWAYIHKTNVVIHPFNGKRILKADHLALGDKSIAQKDFYDVEIRNSSKDSIEENPRNKTVGRHAEYTLVKIGGISILVPFSLKNNRHHSRDFLNYIFSEKDDSELYYNNKFSYWDDKKNSMTVSLMEIQKEVANIKRQLSDSNKFRKLTPTEHLILDLPILMCKLEWVSAAVCMLNWIQERGTLYFDWSWFMRYQFSPIAEQKIKDKFKSAKYLHDIFSVEATPMASYRNISSIHLKKGEDLNYGYGNTFDIKVNYGEKPPLNCAITESLGTGLGTLDEWGAALGRYRLSVYIKGIIKCYEDDKYIFTLNDTIWRFADTFDYEDDKNDRISQPLGTWRHDLYDVSTPSRLGLTTGYTYILNNAAFQGLHKQIHKNKNYKGFLTISEEVIYPANLLLKNTKLPIGY